jgi:bifunctional non-homologous end joining protein LigD
MLATAGELPPVAQDGRWAYEMKWDGVRAITYASAGSLRVFSRNDRDVTGSYPELAGLAAALPGPAILDGELVALDARGRPSFAELQRRMHVTRAADVRRLLAEVPVSYLVFDVLHLGGRLLLDQPWQRRRELLDALELAAGPWALPAYFPGAGAAALAASRAQGLEGVVAKRVDSPYEPGRRSPLWVKVKPVRTQEVVVGGWQPGAGRRAGTIGSLLIGVPDAAGLRYAGNVGTGFTDAILDDLSRRLRPLERPSSPFVDEVPRPQAVVARWVAPVLVGEVAFGEWTRDGRLRHPSWRGLRPDKTPGDVGREP